MDLTAQKLINDFEFVGINFSCTSTCMFHDQDLDIIFERPCLSMEDYLKYEKITNQYFKHTIRELSDFRLFTDKINFETKCGSIEAYVNLTSIEMQPCKDHMKIILTFKVPDWNEHKNIVNIKKQLDLNEIYGGKNGNQIGSTS
jgi:hypothetical protein